MAMAYEGPGRGRPPADRASLRVMYGYVRPHRLALLAGGLLSLATSATGLLLPLVVRALIDDLSRHRGLASLIVIMCLLMAADAVLGAAVTAAGAETKAGPIPLFSSRIRFASAWVGGLFVNATAFRDCCNWSVMGLSLAPFNV